MSKLRRSSTVLVVVCINQLRIMYCTLFSQNLGRTKDNIGLGKCFTFSWFWLSTPSRVQSPANLHLYIFTLLWRRLVSSLERVRPTHWICIPFCLYLEVMIWKLNFPKLEILVVFWRLSFCFVDSIIQYSGFYAKSKDFHLVRH